MINVMLATIIPIKEIIFKRNVVNVGKFVAVVLMFVKNGILAMR
tara:strand:+ start:178 stop:309 length:132 start_codon:yes stop_codon:yes gene_type:complete